MPKMKSHSGTKKRIATTGSGKLRRLRQNRQHLFEKMPSRATRRLAGSVNVDKADAPRIKRLLGMR